MNPYKKQQPSFKLPPINTYSHSSSHINKNIININPNQKLNPIVSLITLPHTFTQIECDYISGSAHILYLSIQYHLLYNDYIHQRIKNITAPLRVILLHIDVDNFNLVLSHVTQLCMRQKFTLILCWSHQEASKYIMGFKAYQSKGGEFIKERVGNDYLSVSTDALTKVRGVNKTDVLTLVSNFGVCYCVFNCILFYHSVTIASSV